VDFSRKINWKLEGDIKANFHLESQSYFLFKAKFVSLLFQVRN
jgi:hypothetical protein